MKKRLYQKIGMIMLVIIAIFFAGTIVSKASDDSLYLRSLNYKVQLNENGSMEVTETWNISIEDTNTLFKTFEIDKSKYEQIQNVEVMEVNPSTGTVKKYSKIQEEKYNVDKDCYYALINQKGKFEIAWGAHAKNTTKTYQIKYQVTGAVHNYLDCSEWYWQLIGNDSEIPAQKVTGTITLPSSVTQSEELRVWAHGPLNGNIQKTSDQMVTFEVENLQANTFLEARIMTPTTIFSSNAYVVEQNRKEEILKQEAKWADEANRQREKLAKQEEFIKKLPFLLEVVGFILAIIIIFKIVKYAKELKTTSKIEPEIKEKYYRDFPDEGATPAEVGLLYYFKQGGVQTQMSEIVSATILDLCYKGYLSFEVSEEKKNTVIITLKEKEMEKLKKDEAIVMEMLTKVSKKGNNTFTMKELQKYMESHASSILNKFKEIEEEAKKQEIKKQNYEEELIKKAGSYMGKIVLYSVLAIFSLFVFMHVIIIPAIIAAILNGKLYGRYHRLTQKGMNEAELWKGLKNYMEDFSMMKEKTVPELVLWEKYLIYATVFGIADKVLKQLKVVYPQMMDQSYMGANGYTYLYLMYHTNLNASLIGSLNNTMKSSYNNINYSSGSGSGGGFSGGGGFGGGGGRNGWQIRKDRILQSRKIVVEYKK